MDTALFTTLIATSASITASIITLTTTKVLEMFQKRQEHRYQRQNLTQKDLFDKKIPIAETAFAQLTLVKTFVSSSRDLLNIFVYALRGEISTNIALSLMTSIVDQAKSISGQIKPFDTSLAWLYFDLKENIDSSDSISDVLNAVSPAILFCNALETKTKNKRLTKDDKIKAVEILIQTMLLLSKFLKSVEDVISENLRAIKSDINQAPKTW
jgi:hypothetical protein